MPDLAMLGEDLKKIDRLIMDLIKRRMDVAHLVAQEKQRTGGLMYRPQIEDQRIAAIGEHAAGIGLNPHMARAVLYFLIAESCKEQTILIESQGEGASARPDAATLRENLLRLTALVAERYDERDPTRKRASHAAAAFEMELLRADAAAAVDKGRALDLGCATGRVALELSRSFVSVGGYDLSQAMVAVAQAKAEAAGVVNAGFAELNLDTQPLPDLDGSVSFVAMNLGTASDVTDVGHVLGEIARVLKPGGRFFLTFYNSEALLYKMGFLPWVASLEAAVNPYTNCLDVKIGDETMAVHAQLQSEADVRALMPAGLTIDSVMSFPQIAAILPDEVLADDKVRATIDRLDRELARGAEGAHGGAYLIVRGVRT